MDGLKEACVIVRRKGMGWLWTLTAFINESQAHMLHIFGATLTFQAKSAEGGFKLHQLFPLYLPLSHRFSSGRVIGGLG